MVGKYLRLFAIKSDEERVELANLDAPIKYNPMQEEFEPDMDRQGQLRDCEQHLKRIFTLCLNDRLVPCPQPEHSLTGLQSSLGRVEKMGDLFRCEPSIQDILQAQLSIVISKYPQDPSGIYQQG